MFGVEAQNIAILIGCKEQSLVGKQVNNRDRMLCGRYLFTQGGGRLVRLPDTNGAASCKV